MFFAEAQYFKRKLKVRPTAAVIIHLDGCILSLSAEERPQSEGPSFERDFANCPLKQMQHKEKSICIIAKRGRNPYKPLCSLELKHRRPLQGSLWSSSEILQSLCTGFNMSQAQCCLEMQCILLSHQ